MTELINALRAKYRTPQAVVRALGLDEALLREKDDPMHDPHSARAFLERLEPMLANDADIKDLLDLIDMVKGAGAGAEVPGEPEEYADEEEEPTEDDTTMPMEQNAAPFPVANKDLDPQSNPMPTPEKKIGTDVEEGDGGKDAKIQALVAQFAAQLTALVGGGAPAPAPAPKPGIDEEPDALKPDGGEGSLKGAMDAAAIRTVVAAAVKRTQEVAREIRDAERFVRPYVGEIAMSFDSAEAVHRAAATMLGIKGADKIHASALTALIEMQPKPGGFARPRAVAMDAASSSDFNTRFPGAARIKI